VTTKTNIPPIKSQGIKTKLVTSIGTVMAIYFNGTWIEPLMVTGTVAFNLAPQHAILCDSNPLFDYFLPMNNPDYHSMS
jgi:DNA adenine methylase